MKKLSFIHKILFSINVFFIVGLLFSFILPYLPPEKFGPISLLSLVVPLLFFGTILFMLYWTFTKCKKQLYSNVVVLIASFFFIPSLFRLNLSSETTEKELSIMSYNVRKFNKFKWINSEIIPLKISQFIHLEKPDIVAFQEYQHLENFKLEYPYYSNPLIGGYRDSIKRNTKRTSLAIYSKFPIINEGVIKYDSYKTSIVYADLVKKKDTIRIYNYHFVSLGIIPDKEYFGHDNSEKLLKRLNESFKIQQKQINVLNEHVQNSPYKVILIGDMNNTPYSWVYKRTKNDLKDSFLEAGRGFGKTYSFNHFPLRIDYIFVDESITVNTHKNFNVQYSDHFPILATVSF